MYFMGCTEHNIEILYLVQWVGLDMMNVQTSVHMYVCVCVDMHLNNCMCYIKIYQLS